MCFNQGYVVLQTYLRLGSSPSANSEIHTKAPLPVQENRKAFSNCTGGIEPHWNYSTYMHCACGKIPLKFLATPQDSVQALSHAELLHCLLASKPKTQYVIICTLAHPGKWAATSIGEKPSSVIPAMYRCTALVLGVLHEAWHTALYGWLDLAGPNMHAHGTVWMAKPCGAKTNMRFKSGSNNTCCNHAPEERQWAQRGKTLCWDMNVLIM